MLIGCSLVMVVTIEMLNLPVSLNILAQFYRFLTLKVHTFVWQHALAVRCSWDCTTCWNEMETQGSLSHFGCTCYTPVQIMGILTLDHSNVSSSSPHSLQDTPDAARACIVLHRVIPFSCAFHVCVHHITEYLCCAVHYVGGTCVLFVCCVEILCLQLMQLHLDSPSLIQTMWTTPSTNEYSSYAVCCRDSCSYSTKLGINWHAWCSVFLTEGYTGKCDNFLVMRVPSDLSD